MNITADAHTLSNQGRSMRFPVRRWLLYLLILSFPFLSIQPEILRPDWWAGALLILAFGFSLLLRGKLRLDAIGRAALGLNAVVLLSVAVNFWSWGGTQWSEFSTLWLQLVFATLLYLSLANLKLSERGLRSLLRLWVFVAGVVAVYGLYQAAARNLDLPLAYLPHLHSIPTEKQLQSGLGYGGYVRPSSFLREPTYFGMYLLPPLALTAVLVFLRQDKYWLFRSRRVNYLLLVLLLGALLASFSLAAYITLVALLVGFLVLHRTTQKVAVRLLLMLLFLFVLVIVVGEWFEISFLQGVTTRISRITNAVIGGGIEAAGPSVPTRYQEILLALSLWVHHPLFGVGLNQPQFVGADYAPEFLPFWVVERGYTHNMWLGVLVQLGVVGLFVFTLLWLWGLRMMHRLFRQGDPPLRALGLGMFYVLLALMIRGLMGGPFTFTNYWFYLGLASMVYGLDRRECHDGIVG